jgi:hypothetical protein
MRRLRPAHIVASHYDDFFKTKKEPPKVIVPGNLEGFGAKAQAAAQYTNFQSIVVPAVGAVMHFPK